MPEPIGGVSKLLLTLASGGLAPLLRPWQMRREGKAKAHNHMRMKLAEAQAEKQIEEIRSGQKIYNPISGELEPAERVPELAIEIVERNQLPVEAREYALGIARLAISDGFRKVANLTDTLEFASEELTAVPDAAISLDPVDEDWLQKWRQAAEDISAEDMQKLWGKLLATEVQRPGAIHTQTIECLKKISSADAQIISRVLRFAVGHKMILNDITLLSEQGVAFDDLVALEELGIVGPINVLGDRAINWSMVPPTPGLGLSLSGGRGVVIIPNELPKTVSLSSINLTRVGRDLFSTLNFEPPPDAYVEKIAEIFKRQGCVVSVGVIRKAPDGTEQVIGARQL